MRKFLVVLFTSFISLVSFSQDFSNKGKDFWLGYGYHQAMTQGSNGQNMVLYFATDQIANVTVSIPLLGYSVTYNNIAANTVFQTPIIPKTGTTDARLYTEGLSNKGIHVTSDVPIVAYAHIYNSSVSGATVLYPVPTLGKSYYSINYKNNSNAPAPNCFFYVVAVDTGTTTVSITPSAATQNWSAGSVNVITLTQGQVYNVMGQVTGNNGVDLTGSVIESIASGTGACKRIAVFSGSGRIAIACDAQTPSSDNYMVQGTPKSSWGKNYITVPSANYSSTSGTAPPMGNMYRICVTDPTTVVTVDGAPIAVPLINGFYYELPQSASFRRIIADKPIMVAQYFPSQADANCGIPSGDGDPEVIYLSSIEQSISTVRWDACNNYAINPLKHYINVVLPTAGTAISSCRLDGAPLPAGTFNLHPQDPNYSYAIIRVSGSSGVSVPHVLSSDSGFNAIAYGYGNAESYGYNAGTNVKDLYSTVGTFTPFGTEPGAVCQGTSMKFKLSLLYQPDSIYWNLSGIANTPQYGIEKLFTPPGSYDSITIVNGKTLYWYSLTSTYVFTTPGSYTIPITVFASNGDGCGGNQDEKDMTFTVAAPPSPDFLWISNGCPAEPVQFNDITVTTKPDYIWNWNFGDPTSPNNTSTLKNPTHIFTGPGTFPVQFSTITTAGCVSSVKQYMVTVPALPTATISTSATNVCVNGSTPNITITGTGGLAPYDFTYTVNGVTQPVVTTNASGIYTIPVPTNTVGPFTYAVTSVKNTGSAVCINGVTGQSATVTVSPYVSMSLTSANNTTNQTLCVNTAITNITYQLTTGGTGATITGGTLPPGVTTNFSGGVFTILGTPTTAGTYNFNVIPAGNCPDPSISLPVTIVVNANATLSFVSGNINQPVCINNNISPIVYGVGGGATSATVTFTPALPGVTGSYDATTQLFTILGAPTVAGTFNYSVATVSTCINPPPLTGTITVNADAAISLTSAAATTAQTKCVNVAIDNITYDISGSVTSVSVSPLPTGVTYNYAPGNPGKLTISGIPTAATPSGPLMYTVSIAGPCQVPVAMTGTINITPDATITLNGTNNNQTVCINNSINQINYTIGGAVTNVTVSNLPAGVTYTYTPGTPTGSLAIFGTPTGTGSTYTITITGPCQVPAPIGGIITVTPDATLTLNSGAASLNQTVCVNNPIVDIQYATSGSATGATIVFTPAGIPPGLTATVVGNIVTIKGTPTVVATTPVVYSFSVNTTGPCANQNGSGTITVNPNHTLTLNTGSVASQTVCLNAAISAINYTFGGGATGVTITGLPAGLNFTVSGNTVTITGSPTGAGGTYTVKTVGNSCITAQLSGTITVNPLPTGNFAFNTPSCNTRSISFTDNSVANVGTITTWSWNFADIGSGANNTSALQNPTHIFSTPGNYSVTLIVTTNNGCTNTITPFVRTVTVNERPHADFNVPSVACISDVVSFTDASTFGTGTENINGYKWDFGDIASGAANTQLTKNGTHQFATAGTYTVTHISQSTAGCLDTITHTITISSPPVSNFSVANAGALCVNDSVAITNTSTIATGSIVKVEIFWDYLNAPGTVVTDNAPVSGTVYKHKYPNFQTPGSKPYTILMRTTSGILCKNDKTTIITVNAVPKVQFNAIPDACYDATPFQITQASEVGGVTGTGTYTGAGVSPTGLFSPKIAGIGTHAIKYTFTSVAGCIDTLSSNIKVLDTASAKFSYATPVCDGSPIVFKDESTAPAGITLGGTVCDMGDGAIVNVTPGGTFTHTYAAWGTYTVTMSAMSTYGCKSTPYTQQVTVHPIPQPAFAFGQTSVCLPNAAVSFINTSSIADNSGITYQWDFGGLSSDPLNSSTAKTPPPHIYNGIGPYTVKLTVIGATGTNGSCNATLSHIVNFIHPQPKAAFDFDKPTICIGDNVTVTDRSNGLDGAVLQRFWDFGDNIKGNTAQVQHLYAVAQTYPVSLYIINSQGCNSDTLTQQFVVNPYPVVDAGPDRVVLEGGSVTMQPVVTGNDLQYLWSPATYLNDVTLATPTANIILNDITYTLTVTGRGGCTAPPDKLFVKVLKAPKVPNTFTPNGDGINDVWAIDYLSTYPNCRVQVFTRSGQLVFESRGYKTPWDGTIKGKPLPFDTYYYILEPGNGRPPSTGYVTIVK